MYSDLPADGESIKLLHLQPNEDTHAVIECALETAVLSDDLKYEALSYTWGDPLPVRSIFITTRGSRMPIDIRENLHDCLLSVRKADEPRKLWIDAICINQEDKFEKGHQIKHMPDIYSTASQVLAWLGESDDRSGEFLAYVNEPGPISFVRLVILKDKFFQRPYWNRTWIVQENLKSREVTFLCGASTTDRSRLLWILK